MFGLRPNASSFDIAGGNLVGNLGAMLAGDLERARIHTSWP
jgi:hypothetical protein